MNSSTSFMSTMATTMTTTMMSMITSDFMEVTDFGFVNGTEEDFLNVTATAFAPPHYIVVLKAIQKWMLTATLVFIMLAMGAVITVNDFRETFRHPVGFIIGFLSQFVTMPLICFVTAIVLRFDTPFALGLLIIGCCPGGTVSNLFTFWTNGDVCLSVCMTSVSCIAAIGMMPLNLLIYSRRWTTAQTKIPFLNIFTTLVTIIVPAIAGMIIRRFSVKWAKRVSQIGGVLGLLCIPFLITFLAIINTDMFRSGWEVWFVATVLPFLGYIFGHGVARIFRQPHYRCRTIGFETGIQNSALGVTIMLLTFGDSDLLYDMLTVPALYGVISFTDFVVYVGFYHTVRYLRKRRRGEFGRQKLPDGDLDEHVEDEENHVNCNAKLKKGTTIVYHPINNKNGDEITVKILPADGDSQS